MRNEQSSKQSKHTCPMKCVAAKTRMLLPACMHVNLMSSNLNAIYPYKAHIYEYIHVENTYILPYCIYLTMRFFIVFMYVGP